MLRDNAGQYLLGRWRKRRGSDRSRLLRLTLARSSMTWSARSSSDGGIVTPSSVAAQRLSETFAIPTTASVILCW